MAVKAGGAYIEIRGDSKKLPGDLKKAGSRVEAAAKKIEKSLNRTVKVMGAVAVASITMGVVALTKRIISLGREFESTMKTVQAWSGATGKDLADLTAIAREMGATTEHTATEAAGALKFLAAAGFDAKKSIAALPGTLDLATAGQVGLARATDITTDVLTAFGLSVEELSRVNDAFITTSSNSNTNVLMLGESFKMVAPTAKLFGLTVEQTAALLGTLANSGIKAEMAGSGLNMALLRSAKAAKKLGLDAGTPLIEVLKRMKEEQWGAVEIADAFGARQVKTAAILMNNIEMFEELTQKIINNKGATKKLAEIIRDSLDVDLKTLNSTIEEELLRTFDKYKDYIREVVQSTTEWIRQNPQAIEQVAELAKNIFELSKAMAKVIGLGVEFTNIWVKTFQAMGLASTGVISWKEALTDGTGAVDQFLKTGRGLVAQTELERELSQAIKWRARAEERGNEISIASYDKKIAKLNQLLGISKGTSRVEEVLADPTKIPTKTSVSKFAAVTKEEYKIWKNRSDAHTEMFDGMRDKQLAYFENSLELRKNFSGKTLEQIISAEQEKLDIQSQFDDQYFEMGKSKFDLERAQLDRQVEIWREVLKDKNDTLIEAKIKEDRINKLYAEEMKKLEEDKYKSMDNAMQGWASGFSSTLNDMLWGAEVTFKSIAESFGKMITQMMIQKSVIEPMFGGGGGWLSLGMKAAGAWLSGGTTTIAGTGVNTAAQQGIPNIITTWSKGGAFPEGINSHSNQVVNKPTRFSFAKGAGLMGEAGPEAIMPLTRNSNGKLGVQSEGGGGNTIVVVANDAKSFADMVKRNPESIITVVNDALENRSGLLDTIRGTV